MITIQEALQLIHSQSLRQEKVILPVTNSLGYYLAEKVDSPMNLPSFDNSAMDGFAICGMGDTFSVIGEIPAGATAPYALKEGEAFRIFTGARIPENTTAVIMQEKTEVVNNMLRISDGITEGKNIRRRGEEIATGQIVFEGGQKMNPAGIGLLSSLGIENIPVYEKPVISILTTGDELVQPGKQLQPGQIFESNGAAIQSAVEQFGFECLEIKHEQDVYEKIDSSIGGFLDTVDVLLISGGISVGDYDFVKKALEENGVEELFYKVKQKPGKPLYFGGKGNAFVFALPGNPASSLTCFYIYVLPLLQRIAGAQKPGLMKFPAPLGHRFTMKSDRPTFMKARFTGEIHILEGQSSSMLHSFATGNALALIEEGPRDYGKGELVECYLL